MVFLTSIAANYLDKAKVMATSLKKFHPNDKFVVLLNERKSVVPEFDWSPFDLVLTPEDLWPSEYEGVLFQYNIEEACTAVKPQGFIHAMKHFRDEDLFIYMDPDLFVFGPLTEVVEASKTYEIILTPHLTYAETSSEGILDNEITGALRHGIYNLGFLAIRRGQHSQAYLEWWANRLYKYCWADYNWNLWTDQKWNDLAPGYFESVNIFRRPGYNIAPWNIVYRKITRENGAYLCNGEPLRFVHFTGFDSGANLMMLKKYCPDENAAIYEIRRHYLAALEANKQAKKVSWSFGKFKNGDPIKKWHRHLFRKSPWANPYENEPSVASKTKFFAETLSGMYKKSRQEFAKLNSTRW